MFVCVYIWAICGDPEPRGLDTSGQRVYMLIHQQNCKTNKKKLIFEDLAVLGVMNFFGFWLVGLFFKTAFCGGEGLWIGMSALATGDL